jgi:hypothetical protein
MDIGFETDNEYRNWTFTEEYEEMTVAYYINELRKEKLKDAV